MTAAPYPVPRRARNDDEFVLDDHDRLLVAVEQQAAAWMSDAHTLQERGADVRTVSPYRAHAEQLRAIARAHSRRRP